jgi:hypothetical protein
VHCGWRMPPTVHSDINKLCNVASCWIYEYIGILLVVHYILHISRIRVNSRKLIIFNWNSERIPVSLKGISAKSSNVPVGQVLSGPELELNYWYKLLKCRCKLIWIHSITSANQSK